jgi:hypothetical protein
MHEKINQLLVFALIIIIASTYYFSKNHQQPKQLVNKNDLVCSNAIDPTSLPFVSYSTKDGFDQCVLRCMHSVMAQVCEQIPEDQNTSLVIPKIKQEIYEECLKGINDIVNNKARYPGLNCQP